MAMRNYVAKRCVLTYTMEELLLLKESPFSKQPPILLEGMGEICSDIGIKQESALKDLQNKPVNEGSSSVKMCQLTPSTTTNHDFFCPSVRRTCCNWTGQLEDIESHFGVHHRSFVLNKPEFNMIRENYRTLNLLLVIRSEKHPLLLKFVPHIDHNIYFYLALLNDVPMINYILEITLPENDRLKVTLQSRTVVLRRDYKAPYEKFNGKAVFAMFGNPEKLKLQFFF